MCSKGCWVVFFIFIQIIIEHSANKQWRPDQMSLYVASNLGLHYLPMSLKKDASLILVNRGLIKTIK